MIAAVILAVLPLAAAATPAPHPTGARAAAKCDRFGRMERASVLREAGPRVQRLDRLPPGDLHLTVERQIDGCHQPVIVRQNFGGAAFRPR
jgi:hypothetical protein